MFPQNKLNTLYPDANLTDIPPNLLLFCLLLCKVSVCCNVFLFWIPKSWLTIFPQCSLPLIKSQESKENSLLFKIEEISKYKFVTFMDNIWKIMNITIYSFYCRNRLCIFHWAILRKITISILRLIHIFMYCFHQRGYISLIIMDKFLLYLDF